MCIGCYKKTYVMKIVMFGDQALEEMFPNDLMDNIVQVITRL